MEIAILMKKLKLDFFVETVIIKQANLSKWNKYNNYIHTEQNNFTYIFDTYHNLCNILSISKIYYGN